jgi:septal ring factor EnvC (AmiA/AmiB activator)
MLATRPGEVARAPASGVVRFAGDLEDLGQTVVIEHDGGLYSVLAKLGELRVLDDVRVAQGDDIGIVKGPLLLQVRQGTTPLDPEPLLRHTGKR